MGWAVSSSRWRPMKPTVAVGRRASAPSSMPRPARRTGTRQTGPEISSTSVSVKGVLIWTWRVGIFPVASATMIRASSFMACLKSAVVVRSSRSTASLLRLRGPSTTWRFFTSGAVSLIQRASLRKGLNPVAQAVCLSVRGRDYDVRDLVHLVLAHAPGRHCRGAQPDAAGHGRWLGVVRDHVLVAGEADGLERIFEFLACDVRIFQVDQDQVVVRPAGDEIQATFQEPVSQGPAVLDDLAGVIFELGLERFTEGDGLAGDGVHQRATLHAREDAAVDLFGELFAAEDHTAAGPPQRLVGRSGYDLAVGYRRGVHVRGDEASDVGHVRKEEGPDLVGDLPEPREVDYARVGAGSGQDHARPLAERDVADLVVVDVSVLADTVVDEVVGPAGEVELHPVREVPAVGEVHGENLVAGVHERCVGGLISLAPRVRLHVDVLRAEELYRPLDGEVLDLVYLLATAVVALARIAFRVLVGKDRALRREDRGRGEVLACDQLDGLALAFEFAVQSLLNLSIYSLGVWSDQDPPPVRVR